MRTEIDPSIIDLPDSPEKRDLLWCASIVSMVDWSVAPLDMQCMARAANTACQLALKLLKEQIESQKPYVAGR